MPRTVNEMCPKVNFVKMFSGLTLLFLALTSLRVEASRIRVEADGGYTGIVIKIDKEVPEDACPEILANLKVRQRAFEFRVAFALPGWEWMKLPRIFGNER